MPKHFVDTSVLRQLVASTSLTKEYYKSVLNSDSIYVAQYARMEYTRGFILNCMQFYGMLSLPGTTGYFDALQLWSNMMQPRSVKAVMSMASNIGNALKNGRLQKFSSDLEFQKKHLGDYIRRLLLKPNVYKNPGIDNELCVRVKYQLNFEPSSINESFVEFTEKFRAFENSKECKMEEFLKNKDTSLQKVINHTSQKKNADGFDKIKAALQKLQKGDHKITCSRCSKIGDSVITILTPSNFNIECVDSSFDDLALALGKSYTKHESELARSKRHK